ncbi:ComF family protein [Salinisphaera aquimarina]
MLCRAPASLARELCGDCEQELPWLTHACVHCALPLTGTVGITRCHRCARQPRFDRALAAFAYDQPIRWLITRLKFDGRLAHARLLGDLLAERVVHAGLDAPEMLVPVPLHPSGYRRRGFNQSERLARRIARVQRRPVASGLVERVRDTVAQSTLSADRRAANVRRAFVCHGSLAGRHVAIVDDVVTTGQTALAVARCLRTAGAARVDLYCVGRA